MLMRCMSNNTGTNSALARDLNVSLPTVKKMWLSIYGRVAASIPGWMAEDSRSSADSKRGKEKRRLLLAYLQDHPEELRPVLRRVRSKAPPIPGILTSQ